MGKNFGFGEGKESQGSTPCMKHCLLQCYLVVQILERGNSFEGNIPEKNLVKRRFFSSKEGSIFN